MRAGEIQQLITNLVSQADRKGAIRLDPGQIISVLLKEIQGDMALLTYRGQEIMARLEAEVPPGEILRCLVMGEKNDQLVLKILSSIEEADIRLKFFMNQAGLEENPANSTLVKEMINRQMPINHDKVRLFSAFVKNYNLSDAEAWIPVFMDSRGIPLTEKNFNVCRDMLGTMKNLHGDLTELGAQLKTLLGSVSQDSPLGRLAQKILSLLENMALKSNEGQGASADKLFNAFRLFNSGESVPGIPNKVQNRIIRGGNPDQPVMAEENLPQENLRRGISNTPDGETTQNKNTAEFAVKPEIGRTAVSADIKEMQAEKEAGGNRELPEQGKEKNVKDILERFTMLLKESPVLQGKNIQQPLNDIRKLLDLSMSLQEESLPELLEKLSGLLKKEGEHVHRELTGLVTSVADKVDLIKNLNQPVDTSRDQMTLFYSKVDLGNRQEPVSIQMKYKSKGKGSPQDFSNCHIKVSLHTVNMGFVTCEVQLNSRALSLQFSADNEKAAATIENLQVLLGQRLEQMSYSVALEPCKVVIEPQYVFSPEENPVMPGLFQVNLTV